MKKYIGVTIVVLTLLITSGFSLENVTNDDKRIEVIFNRTLNFNDIVKIKLDLSDKGISIDYKLLEFDEYGGLHSIDFIVDSNDGFYGSAKYINLHNDTKFGFIRDYNKDAPSPFSTGHLK